MVQIVFLAKGAKPLPAAGKAFIIDVGGPRASESMDDSPTRMVLRIPSSAYDDTIATWRKKFAAHPDRIIYVRGHKGTPG